MTNAKQFFKSEHCKGNHHCNRCRDLEGGRRWRDSIVKVFTDVVEVDFACPVNYPWGAVISRGKPDLWGALFSEINLLPGEDKATMWLQSMAAQLQNLRQHPPRHVKCRNRSSHNTRCLKKLEHYYEEYKRLRDEKAVA